MCSTASVYLSTPMEKMKEVVKRIVFMTRDSCLLRLLDLPPIDSAMKPPLIGPGLHGNASGQSESLTVPRLWGEEWPWGKVGESVCSQECVQIVRRYTTSPINLSPGWTTGLSRQTGGQSYCFWVLAFWTLLVRSFMAMRWIINRITWHGHWGLMSACFSHFCPVRWNHQPCSCLLY